jgi:hypothetical protein
MKYIYRDTVGVFLQGYRATGLQGLQGLQEKRPFGEEMTFCCAPLVGVALPERGGQIMVISGRVFQYNNMSILSFFNSLPILVSSLDCAMVLRISIWKVVLYILGIYRSHRTVDFIHSIPYLR